MDIGTKARRDREFAQCRNKHEVDQLMDRWTVEDAEALLATKHERQQLDELRQRVRQLERVVATMPKALGEVIGRHVKQALEAHPGMRYGGVWCETQAYPIGTVITDKGSAWVATAPAEKGQRPSRSPSWRLMAKGTEQQGTVA